MQSEDKFHRRHKTNLTSEEKVELQLWLSDDPNLSWLRIQHEIYDHFGKRKSKRSCQKYISDKAKSDEREREKAKIEGRDHLIDDLIDWHRLDILRSYGCVLDTLPIIRDVHGWFESSLKDAPFPLRESYRWVKWATYVSTYAGNYIDHPFDTWAVAWNFARRDRFNQSVGISSRSGFEDLDSWLMHRPWVEKKEQVYLDMVNKGVVKPIYNTRDIPALDYAELTSGGFESYLSQEQKGSVILPVTGKEWIANFFTTLWKERPYMLPTQQLEFHRTQFRQRGMGELNFVFKVGETLFPIYLT